MGFRDYVNPITVHYATQIFVWGAWTTAVAIATRWTVRRDTMEYLLVHMDEISRRELLLAKDRIAELEKELEHIKSYTVSLRAWKRRVKGAVNRVDIGED